jgi:hypothetical protein
VTYGTSKMDEFMNVVRDNRYHNYIFEIAGNWNNVRPHIEPHSFGPLPPFATDKALGK